MVTKLKSGEVFVFGSNTAGRHGAGAARQARLHFGAKLGVGEGMQGQSYAFPTLDDQLRQRTTHDLEQARNKLYECCLGNPGKRFILTKVGCGLANYKEEFMRGLFVDPPANLILPEDWRLS
jgi:hypothetical protein